jgi:hypothetical protein
MMMLSIFVIKDHQQLFAAIIELQNTSIKFSLGTENCGMKVYLCRILGKIKDKLDICRLMIDLPAKSLAPISGVCAGSCEMFKKKIQKVRLPNNLPKN